MTPGNLIYIISDEFDYDKVISAAAGYRYANDMGLAYDNLSNIGNYLDKFIIIDNRLTEKDCSFIKAYVQANTNTTFVFKIVDPYEVTISQYTRTLFDLTEFNNVKFLSTYSYTANTKEIYIKVGDDRMVHIPYAFNPENIVENNETKRINRIILSGAKFKHFYPLRRKMMKDLYRFFNIRMRRYTDVLTHPGYTDIGDKKKHDLIGEKYLQFLSKYRFMLVTPSIYDLELLKYNECAYAGCVPVGVAPASLPDEARKYMLYLDIKKSLGKQVSNIINSTIDTEEMARGFRNAMQNERSKDKLQKRLTEFLIKVQG